MILHPNSTHSRNQGTRIALPLAIQNKTLTKTCHSRALTYDKLVAGNSMDTRLVAGDLQSQIAASRAKTEALASAQEAAECRAHSLLKPEHEPSPEDDGTISWSAVLENDVERHGVDNANLGMTEMSQVYWLDLETGGTMLSHSGLVVLGNSSDMSERRRRGMRMWQSGDAVELLEGLWRGIMGCFRGLFSVLGVRMETREERMPLVGVCV